MFSKFALAAATIAALALAGCADTMSDKGSVSDAANANEPVSGDPAASTAGASPNTGAVATTSDGDGTAGVSNAAGPNEPVSGDQRLAGAMDTCLEEGGNVVAWTDADGNSIDACRMADGSEMSLDDIATYGL